MAAIDLRKEVESHRGVFLCERIHDSSSTKEVNFSHRCTPPCTEISSIPNFLADFYATFGSLLLYHDPASGDAAYYIASPNEWPLLSEYFQGWLEDLDKEEESVLLPDWMGEHLVIGEIPKSDNYLLVPLAGDKKGFVYEFEHDGFEFFECAPSIELFVQGCLDLDNAALSRIATYMRFVENEDWATQWWIAKMRDNRGNFSKTRE